MKMPIATTIIILTAIVTTSAYGGNIEGALAENKRRDSIHVYPVQLAASGNRLSGPQIRALLSVRTARMERRRANKVLSIALSFGADRSVRHACEATHVNVNFKGTPQCRTPRASGNWSVQGSKLCVNVGKRRCYFVVRSGGGHVFRSPSGKGRPYAGKFSVN